MEMVVSGPDAKAEKIVVEVSVKESLLDNPYAGHLENQQISRLTQVQADVVEGDGRAAFNGNVIRDMHSMIEANLCSVVRLNRTANVEGLDASVDFSPHL